MNHPPYICGPSCPRCQEERQRVNEHIASLERELEQTKQDRREHAGIADAFRRENAELAKHGGIPMKPPRTLTDQECVAIEDVTQICKCPEAQHDICRHEIHAGLRAAYVRGWQERGKRDAGIARDYFTIETLAVPAQIIATAIEKADEGGE